MYLFQELCITTNTNDVYVTIPIVHSVPGQYSLLFLKSASKNMFRLWVTSPVTKTLIVGFALFKILLAVFLISVVFIF